MVSREYWDITAALISCDPFFSLRGQGIAGPGSPSENIRHGLLSDTPC